MKKWLKTEKLFGLAAVLFTVLGFTNCKDDTDTGVAYNPGQPVIVEDFSPKEGKSNSKFFIKGRNFGNDKSKVKVMFGDKEANVIGLANDLIYCAVPMKAGDSIKVSVAGSKFAVADSLFNYVSQTVVSTLFGWKDENGKTESKDGPFDVAGTQQPDFMTTDPKNPDHIYFVDGWGAMLRRIDKKTGEVTTVLTKGEGNWERLFNCTFTASGDTMLITNLQDADKAIAVSGVLRSNGFKRPFPIVYGRSCSIGACHPVNGELYYSAQQTGSVLRYDFATGQSETLFRLKNGQKVDMLMHFNPTGDFAYFLLNSSNKIMISEYDWENKRLTQPRDFVGGSGGFLDGSLTNAKLNYPVHGVFVKNEDYVKMGREEKDWYDFYFCDQWNHCVRKLDPDGNVSLYAGRGSKGVNNSVNGWIDGHLTEEARFNRVRGIAYDPESEIFYISDQDNYRVRTIVVDK